MAQDGQIFVSMTEANPRFIFAKCHSEHPMHPVFDAPVASDRRCKQSDD